MDPYYSRGEVSNSDLSWLKRQLYPAGEWAEPLEAYRFGRLLDYMVTEPYRVDTLRKEAGGEPYGDEDWERALAMKQALLRDGTGRQLHGLCKGQEVMAGCLELEAYGVPFRILARCKYDFWSDALGFGGDLKSTTAETQRQFEQAAAYFDYDRQRAWYMDISGAERDILIAVSKKNMKVFKIPITRQSAWYKEGRRKYLDLAFRWNVLFGERKDFKTY